MASRAYAVIAGVGPGTGEAIARRFASAYPVALLARDSAKIQSLVQDINDNSGKAMAISADVSSEASVKTAFEKIDEAYGREASCAAAIFNASAIPAKKPLLEMSLEEFTTPWEVSCKGALIFSQASLPRLLKHASNATATTTTTTTTTYPPTLIFTGATASTKASAGMSGFACAKTALRALSLSIAKEFGKQGVHVAHAVIDGVIDTPATKEYMKDVPPEGKLGPEDIAAVYWGLHVQSGRGFSNEVDVRPMLEDW